MKTLNLETCKRLQDKGLLNDIETEYIYVDDDIMTPHKAECMRGNFVSIKAPNLGESLDFIPKVIEDNKTFCIFYDNENKQWIVSYEEDEEFFYHCSGQTLLEAIDKMFNFLLDNDLL